MFDDWRLRDEIRFLLKKIFRMKRWKSLIFGLEIGLYFISIYILMWSFEVGVRRVERRIG